jgi:CheY-like chemotaxis protein
MCTISDGRMRALTLLELAGPVGPRQAGELALATAPEVVFIDIRRPGSDGHEVARRLRAALRRRSSEAGFDAHLVKPVSDEDLTRVLDRAAGGDG